MVSFLHRRGKQNVVEILHKTQKDEDQTQDYEEWKRKMKRNDNMEFPLWLSG